MVTVYVVESLYYSDVDIYTIFATRESAEDHKAGLEDQTTAPEQWYRVREMTVNP